jgi:hypothetical protein
LKSGALSRGTVIGLITASGKGAIVLSTATDGTKDPYGVLTEDIDATAADVETTVYVTGEFNEDALTFGGEDTKATHKVGMRQIGLFLKPINK